MTANTLTSSVIRYLTMAGFKVWRQNNHGVPKGISGGKIVYRASNNNLKGVSDVLGFCKSTGKIIAVEVKIGKDKLSAEQSEFLDAVDRSGGIALVAKNIDDFLKDCKALGI